MDLEASNWFMLENEIDGVILLRWNWNEMKRRFKSLGNTQKQSIESDP